MNSVTRPTPLADGPAIDGHEDKAPLFLPNRAAFRRAAKPVKSRLRKSTKWAHRMESSDNVANHDIAPLFHHLAAEARRDLKTLQEARA